MALLSKEYIYGLRQNFEIVVLERALVLVRKMSRI